MNATQAHIPSALPLPVPQSSQYATFRVGGMLLGVEVIHVQEVLRYQEMTQVPLSPSAVEGLINLRGQIVVAIDMRRSLGLGARPEPTPPMNIVLEAEDGVVSLLVDEVHDVIDVPHDRYAPVPETMPPMQRRLIRCVFALDDGLMLVLNTAQVLDNACHGQRATRSGFELSSSESVHVKAQHSRGQSHAQHQHHSRDSHPVDRPYHRRREEAAGGQSSA